MPLDKLAVGKAFLRRKTEEETVKEKLLDWASPDLKFECERSKSNRRQRLKREKYLGDV